MVGIKYGGDFQSAAVWQVAELLLEDMSVREEISSLEDEDMRLTFRRRIKSRLPFAGIIRRLTYSTRFQDKG